MPAGAGGPLHRDSLLQRSKNYFYKKNNNIELIIEIILGGNGIDFFQADQLTAQYLQPTSPTPGLPIAVRR